MTRVEKHRLPLTGLKRRLVNAGNTVEAVPTARGYDLLVNGNVRLAVRVAFSHAHNHHVTVKGQRYTYRYKFAHFNFHHHGRMDQQYADYVICIVMDPQNLGVILSEYVVPWAAITAKTFSVHTGKKAYHGRFALYRDHWEGVVPIGRVA